jgi:hypothetical protein
MKLFCSITKYTFALLLFFAFLSCSKEEQNIKTTFLDCDKGMTNNIDTVRNHIVGKYDWVYTFRGYRLGSYYGTPETENKTISYLFKPNNEFEIQENGIITESYFYEVGSFNELIGMYPDKVTIAVLKDKKTGIRKNYYELYLCNDSLMISRPESFSFSMNFKRGKL